MIEIALARWEAVQARDTHADTQFVYAVQTTGIFCKPSCPSRRPARDHVVFYDDATAARAAGFRPCRRCHPDTPAPLAQSDLIAAICRALEADGPIPSLGELGDRFGLSPTHLQRTFAAAVGVSPRQYAARCRRERLRAELRAGAEVTSAIYAAGYRSSSAFYMSDGAALGLAPANFRRGAPAAAVRYALASCALGQLLVAATERGVCFVSLGDEPAALLTRLRREYPAACAAADGDLAEHLAAVLRYLEGALPHPDLPLDVRATAFQEQVWRALRVIPPGTTASYGAIARAIGQPNAARAVAQACAANPVPLIIPCHRVVRGDGDLGGYRLGVARKAKLLAAEERHHADGG